MKTQPSGASVPPSRRSKPFAISRIAASPSPVNNAAGLLTRAWEWIRTRQLARTSARRLQVTSTVSLGEKRFIAVVQVDGLQFLVGGGASNVALLAQLDKKESFDNVLEESVAITAKQPAKRTSKQPTGQIDTPRAKPSRAQAWSTL